MQEMLLPTSRNLAAHATVSMSRPRAAQAQGCSMPGTQLASSAVQLQESANTNAADGDVVLPQRGMNPAASIPQRGNANDMSGAPAYNPRGQGMYKQDVARGAERHGQAPSAGMDHGMQGYPDRQAPRGMENLHQGQRAMDHQTQGARSMQYHGQEAQAQQPGAQRGMAHRMEHHAQVQSQNQGHDQRSMDQQAQEQRSMEHQARLQEAARSMVLPAQRQAGGLGAPQDAPHVIVPKGSGTRRRGPIPKEVTPEERAKFEVWLNGQTLFTKGLSNHHSRGISKAQAILVGKKQGLGYAEIEMLYRNKQATAAASSTQASRADKLPASTSISASVAGVAEEYDGPTAPVICSRLLAKKDLELASAHAQIEVLITENIEADRAYEMQLEARGRSRSRSRNKWRAALKRAHEEGIAARMGCPV